jgi:hypothetical protein
MTVAGAKRGPFTSIAILLGILGGPALAAPTDLEVRSDPDVAHRLRGVASCSTLSCHGGPEHDAATDPALSALRSAYTVWAERDPHARAYTALFGERSRRIVSWLQPGSESDPSAYLSVLERDCISCHATTLPDPATRQAVLSSDVYPGDGVGCESCHGAASGWIREHVLPRWRGLPRDDKSRRGLLDTRDLSVRAGICAACHVGDPEGVAGPRREVTHELLGAGHPRLAFDLHGFQSRATDSRVGFAHWDVAADRRYLLRAGEDGGPKERVAFEAESWITGQVVSAAHRMRQLAYRAQLATRGDRAWPELAEMDCYACHHGLSPDRNPRGPRESGRRPGALLPNGWGQATARALLAEAGVAAAGRTLLEVDRALKAGVVGDAGKVAALAATSAGQLPSLVEPCVALASSPDRMLKALLGAEVDPSSWDEVAGFYWGAHALTAGGRERRSDVLDALRELALALDFPRGGESPAPQQPELIAERVASVRAALSRNR